MTLSVRLGKATERMVARLAKARGVTRSDVVREALALLSQQDSGGSASFHDQIGDLVGSVSDLPEGLSERTGTAFRQRLTKRRP
jgi:Arc/MetJ-type ribon-helix-helix transcriptional regulator